MSEKKNPEKNRKPINWFPGHMAKANRQIQEQLQSVDLIIEIRDARIPESSSNPDFAKLSPQKPRIIVLNKSDKADTNQTNLWIKQLSDENRIVLSMNSLQDNILSKIYPAAKELTEPRRQRQIKRGMNPTPMKAMVLGIPNVGKSTIINKLAKKKIANTADKPGVTKKVTWFKVKDDFYLLDTPGVLWPKFESIETGIHLAITGAIRDEVVSLVDLTDYALDFLKEFETDKLINQYGIEISSSNEEMIEGIGKRYGLLEKGGNVDFEKTRKRIIQDIRDNVLGPITWERAQ